MQQQGKAPVDWGSKATSVQTVAWPERYGSWSTTTLAAEAPTLTGHLMVSDLHADVSSTAAGIYAGSIGLSQGMWLPYVSKELGIAFLKPINIGMDNATAVAYANGTMKCSKTRQIDAHQDWVQAMRGSLVCKVWKVRTLENESDLLTKIHVPDRFVRLHSQCMVFQKTPTGQPGDAATGINSKRGADG